VVLSVSDTIVFLTGTEDSASSTVFAAVKTMKMFRILRLFRVFRFSRKLSHLAMMISDSLNALLWAVVMMVLIIYIFAILVASNCAEWLKSQLDPDGEGFHWLSLASESDNESLNEIARRFGTLSGTANSLLQIMLGGCDWGDIVDASMVTGGLVPTLLYLFVSFTMLAVLNVVTGVFVDNALENTKKQQQYQLDKARESENEMLKQMSQFFAAVDVDNDGYLSKDELHSMLDREELTAVLDLWGFRPDDVLQMYTLLDEDQDGLIKFNEFSRVMEKLRGPARSIDLHILLARDASRHG